MNCKVQANIMLKFDMSSINVWWDMHGPMKPRVGPGPNAIWDPILNRSKNLNTFDEMKYIMWTYKSVLVGNVAFESF